jgi:hypothetical protein
VGIRCADHATPSTRKKLALTSPTNGGRSVGIVRLRTKTTEFSFSVFSIRRRWVVSFTLRPRFPRIALDKRLSGPHSRFGLIRFPFWGRHIGLQQHEVTLFPLHLDWPHGLHRYNKAVNVSWQKPCALRATPCHSLTGHDTTCTARIIEKLKTGAEAATIWGPRTTWMRRYFNLRRVRRMGHVARMRGEEGSIRYWWESQKERNH